MKNFPFLVILFVWHIAAQAQTSISPMDGNQYGVVLDHPGMKAVVVKADIPFLSDAKGQLHMDIYQPVGLKKQEKRPAIVFLNGIGDDPGYPKLKTWGIYSSWPRLIAANGYIGITMETDGNRIQESLQGIFDFLAQNGDQYQVDAGHLGVYAASANVRESMTYLMGEKASKGIKAVALYYGWPPAGPYRQDLPVLAVVAQSDAHPGTYDHLWKDVLANHAPWTLKMATGLPHAFDAFTDKDESRKVILETIAFWKTHLEPVPAPSWKHSKARDAISAMYAGDKVQVLALLKELVVEYPQDIGVLSSYGRELNQQGDLNDVEVVYQKILQLAPDNLPETINYIGVLYRNNKSAEAEKLISSAMLSGKMDAQAYSMLGYNLLVAGKDLEAAKYYEMAISIKATSCWDYYNLGCAYAKIGNLDKAFPALEQAIDHGCNSKEHLINDGDLAPLKSDSRFSGLVEKTR